MGPGASARSTRSSTPTSTTSAGSERSPTTSYRPGSPGSPRSGSPPRSCTCAAARGSSLRSGGWSPMSSTIRPIIAARSRPCSRTRATILASPTCSQCCATKLAGTRCRHQPFLLLSVQRFGVNPPAEGPSVQRRIPPPASSVCRSEGICSLSGSIPLRSSSANHSSRLDGGTFLPHRRDRSRSQSPNCPHRAR